MKNKGYGGLKRVSLYFVSTSELLLRRANPRYDTDIVGPQLAIRMLVDKMRSVLGPWNAGFPSTIRLQNLHGEFMHLADHVEVLREELVLRALSRSCRILGFTPSAAEAMDRLVELQAIMLDDCSAHLAPRDAYQRFAKKRCDELRRLAGLPDGSLRLSR